jgi:hypothetical protein
MFKSFTYFLIPVFSCCSIFFSGSVYAEVNLNKLEKNIQNAYKIKGPYNSTLVRILKRGKLLCDRRADISVADNMSATFCENLAIAIFNDPSKVEIQTNSTADAFAKIFSGDLDVTYRAVTTNFISRVTPAPGVPGDLDAFGPVWFYDATVISSKIEAISSAHTIGDQIAAFAANPTSTLCIIGTTGFRDSATLLGRPQSDLNTSLFEFNNDTALVAAYNDSQCDSVMEVESVLVGLNLDGATINSSSRLTKTTMSPFYDSRDPQFRDLVFWVTNAPIEAEICSITGSDASDGDPVTALSSCSNILNVGTTPANFSSQRLFLNSEQAFRNLLEVNGNWKEIFEKNGGTVGTRSGINQLCGNGGALCSIDYR